LRVAASGGTLPFDVAFSAGDDFVLAWLIANGENNGAVFDWIRMRWITKS
jgi:hypothetical protein